MIIILKRSIFIFLKIYIFIFFNISCGKKFDERVTIQISDSYSKFGDGTFLSFAGGIEVDSQYIYISDLKNSRILILDTLFNLYKTIGSFGRGPGEFNQVSTLKLNRNLVYAYDEGGRINIYSKLGRFIRFIIPEIYFLPYPSFFLYDSLNIITPNFTSLKPIAILSDSGKVIKEFGESVAHIGGKFYPYHNSRFIFQMKNYVYALCQVFPFIEKYDRNGNLLERKNLALDYEEIEKEFMSYEIKYRNLDEGMRSLTVYNIFTSAIIEGNYMYAGFKRAFAKEGEVFHEIIKIDLRDLKIKKVIVPIDIENKNIYFSCIAKNKNTFYLGSDEIHKLYYDE